MACGGQRTTCRDAFFTSGCARRAFPEKINGGTGSYPESSWHYPISWGPRLSKEKATPVASRL